MVTNLAAPVVVCWEKAPGGALFYLCNYTSASLSCVVIYNFVMQRYRLSGEESAGVWK